MLEGGSEVSDCSERWREMRDSPSLDTLLAISQHSVSLCDASR